MSTLLVKHATILATMDGGRREIPNGAVFARAGVIEAVGTTADLPQTADQVVDATDHVVIPGLVNTHHHLFQNLVRVVPGGQDAQLFGWLTTLYPIFAQLRPEHFRSSALIGLAELALTGCTTSSDHQYIFPHGTTLEDSIESARAVGLRFTATRGAMTIGESQGGLPPDSLVENEAAVMRDYERVIRTLHDPARFAQIRVALAPCSPFSVSEGLMRDTALLAREKGVGLHTHLAENDEDIAFSLAKFGKRPGPWIESLGWTGPDVWHAHCVKLDDTEIALFGRTGTGIAHCPCSNMRLASGILPLRKLLDARVTIGLGVDGSASNDSGHLLNEARQAMLLQRVVHGPGALTAREALEIATRGGAKTLNRDDIGHLAPGMAADMAAFKLGTIETTGADWDPVAALIFCGPLKASFTIVGGKSVVRNGELTSIDLPRAIHQHRALARDLMHA